MAELRRRQVFRAAAWYGGLAWIAVEVANTVFPQFGLPSWSVRAVIVAALLGLPVALLLAWSFDLTSAGLRRETDSESGAPPPAVAPFWRMPSLWIALVLGAGLTLSAQQAWQRVVRPALGGRPGIAVLPFANLSPEPDNAFFADGLHEEVLGALATIGGLRVISRTSVQKYRDTRLNLREVADALDATLILEGTVRRDGDNLRLALRLVDGHTDLQLWSETYDRKFRDALDLQRAVARQVAVAIGAKLTPTEQKNLRRATTDSPAAYERYLQALAVFRNTSELAPLRNAERLLGDAIAKDPRFTSAYALRARVRVKLLQPGWGTTADAEGARADVDAALRLEPDSPHALVAQAMYQTYVDLAPAAALPALKLAATAVPNDADVLAATALTLRRLGRPDDAAAYFELASAVSPGDDEYAFEAAMTMLDAKRYATAVEALCSLAAAHSNEPSTALPCFFARFVATGDTSGWHEYWERIAPTLSGLDAGIAAYYSLIGTGDLAGLVDYYQRAPDDSLFAPRDLMLGLAYGAMGEPGKARPHLEAAARLRSPPDTPSHVEGTLSAERAVALELIGEHEAALTTADAAVRLMPEARDATNGADIALRRAWVMIHSRQRAEEGYAELARLMDVYAVHPRWLTVDPMWLLLRNDERVQQILHDAIAKL